MHPWTMNVLRIIYPIDDTTKIRDRPMKVLCLGLARTGTDSLTHALQVLGYDGVHHGFDMSKHPEYTLQYIRLATSQLDGNSSSLQAKDFDRVLGNYEAVTDIPFAQFYRELLEAYPDAKVIVNYRPDVEAWHQSCIRSIDRAIKPGGIKGWLEWILTFFESEMFWAQRRPWYTWYRFVDDDFNANGRAFFQGHYDGLIEKLKADSREYLQWEVKEGWEPLCKFLDKPVPNEPFPNRNVPASFLEIRAALTQERRQRALRNVAFASAVLVVFIACLIAAC